MDKTGSVERNVEDQLFKDLRNSLERRMILKNKLKSTKWQTKTLTNEGKGEMGNTLTSNKTEDSCVTTEEVVTEDKTEVTAETVAGKVNILRIALEANKFVPEITSTQGDDPEDLAEIVRINNAVLRDEAPPSIIAGNGKVSREEINRFQ